MIPSDFPRPRQDSPDPGAARPSPLPAQPETLVLGATGFIGRWLVLELLGRGVPVAAGVRGGHARDGELRRWLREHGADDRTLTTVAADITRPALGLDPADDARLEAVRDVFNAAALYRFGLSRREAETVNLDGALHTLHWAATRPRLRRLVHLSGYRVERSGPGRYPLTAAETDSFHARHGAYEASKVLGDAAVRAEAPGLDVPLTTVNPSSVVGHSATGEAGQYLGLAELVRQLWIGRLPALPATPRTFLPVVAVDYLARFLAAVPEHDQGPSGAHTVLDASTPVLPELVGMLAEHLGVPAPRRLISPDLVRRLPRALTGADPETLSFLSEDRYDTDSADRLAAAVGLRHPPVGELLRRWADRLVADRFGAAPPGVGRSGLKGSFHAVAGSRTYVAGERRTPGVVLLHGLPLDSDSWHDVVSRLDAPVLLADLPGLGRSSPASATPDRWLAELLAAVDSRPVLVGHSGGVAPALRYANAHPDRVSGLVLVAPYFLQLRTGLQWRMPVLPAAVLRHASPDRLAVTLLGTRLGDSSPAGPVDPAGPAGSAGPAAALRSAAAHLHRPRVAARTVTWLRRAQRAEERAALAALLQSCPVPVRLVAGELDPLSEPARGVPAAVIPQARHSPQISHPGQLARILAGFAAEVAAGTAPAGRPATRGTGGPS